MGRTGSMASMSVMSEQQVDNSAVASGWWEMDPQKYRPLDVWVQYVQTCSDQKHESKIKMYDIPKTTSNCMFDIKLV